MESKELSRRNWNNDDSPHSFHTSKGGKTASHRHPAGTDRGLRPLAHQGSDASLLSPAPSRKNMPAAHGCSHVSGARVSIIHWTGDPASSSRK